MHHNSHDWSLLPICVVDIQQHPTNERNTSSSYMIMITIESIKSN